MARIGKTKHNNRQRESFHDFWRAQQKLCGICGHKPLKNIYNPYEFHEFKKNKIYFPVICNECRELLNCFFTKGDRRKHQKYYPKWFLKELRERRWAEARDLK